MIKYYNTEKEYLADAKSAFESQVSLIGADNAVKFDGRNVVVDIRSAKTGSIVVLDGLHAMRFIAVDTFSSESFMSNYEIVGVVSVGVDHPSFRGQVVIMNKEFPSKKMSEIFTYRLTGYVLDGTARTGVLSVREASDNWAVNHDYTVPYAATTEYSFVNQLNTYFKANDPFKSQKWQAFLNEDNSIGLVLNYKNYSEAYATGKNGFSLSANLFPEWIAISAMLRMNGQRLGEGIIANWSCALTHFRNDTANTIYNPNADVTSVKLSYPICLPGYLGTSQYQSDHCAFLRGVYGEGEEGWLRFMRSFLPVRPTEYGSNGDKAKYGDARKNTYYLAGQKYTDIAGEEKKACPAADFVANVGYDHELLAKGQWVLPDSDLLFDVVGGIEYGTTNNRDADVINRALKAIGALGLSNKNIIWSCSRSGNGSAWSANGNYGCMLICSIYNSCLVVPLVLLDVPQSALL